ncbi:MAG: hypothetical protein CVV30_08115 [Methanomicrobiales archaeon HGW-Methanomicrobiales-1]|jgi:hypothetical protein|nr:MAG: hypothetical protein CVV30_08115 [Methanomicrobiales archaeon HGW-Methanomicrobiales-1]
MQNDNEQKNNGASVTFRTIAHFYDPDDPTPENNRELSDRAEEKIFREVLDVGSQMGHCDQIEIALPQSEMTSERQAAIPSSIRSHFRSRAGEVQRDMRLTQKVGLREFRLTLAVCIPSFIGIAICSQFKGDPLVEVIENVLVIFCWVTIWQPFQSLVFDRWTQSETAKVYRKIAEMAISVRAA